MWLLAPRNALRFSGIKKSLLFGLFFYYLFFNFKFISSFFFLYWAYFFMPYYFRLFFFFNFYFFLNCQFFFNYFFRLFLSNKLFLDFGKKSFFLFLLRLFNQLPNYTFRCFALLLNILRNLGYCALQLFLQEFEHFVLLKFMIIFQAYSRIFIG